ncbi:ARF guanine-nucleotide exchange factor GNOM isoform B [Micractinium conductrix]|uniref:ARF guanine-nucleotide exchange factor GNOM isoform B n=1 Tax=Micractinium conductrix TaxID=554055 RepID=A0A2P6VJY3_9CHLO|nr:ARF guanine-nucleotide exchange factor GNOM isoform B [Micractinium conductrix]|eukprot:PSC74405.1 ARF guanine-nucleotide exchange factor GNOM isoform B [Micractinium conductrix]
MSGAVASAQAEAAVPPPPDQEQGFNLMSLEQRRRTFFKYEKRVRELSPPEKVFEYFASQREGKAFSMTAGDMMRSVVPVFPPEGSDVIRAGSLPGEPLPHVQENEASKVISRFDINGDDKINFDEFLLFQALLSIPVGDLEVAFRLMDKDGSGKVDHDEFGQLLAAIHARANKPSVTMRKSVSSSSGGSGEDNLHGLLSAFFGADGRGQLSKEAFRAFVLELRDELLRLEFEWYDWRRQGAISGRDFAHSIVSCARLKHVDAYLDKCQAMPAELAGLRVSFEEFRQFRDVWRQLRLLSVALEFMKNTGGKVGRSEFAFTVLHVLGIKLRPQIVDVMFYLFGAEGDHLNVNYMYQVLNRHYATGLTASYQFSKEPKTKSYLECDDEVEDPLLEEFKELRRKLFVWPSWDDVHPLEYLTPFIETVKSPETNGPITVVALTSLHRIITRSIIGASSGGAAAAEAIQAVADGVTQCKFESTYAASDECVLHSILDVLVAAVGCPAGGLLTNDNLINIFQACYRIGHFQTEKGRDTSELLTQASRQAMGEMVHQIFSRLDVIPEPLDSPFAPAASTAVPRLQVSPAASRAGAVSLEAEAAGGGEGAAAGEDAAGAAAAAVAEADAAVAAAAGNTLDVAAAAGDGAAIAAAAADEAAAAAADELPPQPSPTTVLSLLPMVAVNHTEQEGYGVEAVREVLLFIISLIASAPVGTHQDLPAHGLDLMSTAMQAAGPALEHHDSLMVLLQQDLMRAMFAAARQPSLACLAGLCEVALALYTHLGAHMLLQVEALLSLLVLPLAEGKAASGGAGAGPAAAAAGISLEVQQVALEGVLDFCAQPDFVRDAFLNLDCRVERCNLFEQLCGLLSKTAFPVNGPVAAVHLQSVDGILAILSTLAATCTGVCDPDAASTAALEDPPAFVDIWTALSAGQHPPLEQLLGLPDGSATPADLARAEKALKGKLAAAADHFNREQKRGFQYLQSVKLLPAPLEPTVLARFLRCCPGLAKNGIGEILGEREAFYEQVREAFMHTFDFIGMDFDAALRMFMDSFRPPGEGQKIDRIMQVFGKRYFEQMPSMGLKSADAAYVLAFSVIMLNTDLHNTQNKKKMSLEDFARINRSTNEGDPMPRDLLEGIYASISRDELKISSESGANELPSIFWYQLAVEARRPRGKMLPGTATNEALERDMFGLVWGPTLAAVSVVLDNAGDGGSVRRALDCLALAARMAAYHQVDEVVDSIVVALSKFSAVLTPPKGVEAFGESAKARAALETMFAIANRYGDWLRSGWRNVLDVVLRLHRLDLLPPAVIAGDGEELEEVLQRWPRPQAFNKGKGSSGSLFSRVAGAFISIDGTDALTAEQAAQRDADLQAAAAASVEACHVEEIFADSKFLTGESLVELVKAVMWSAGPVAEAAKTGQHTRPAELCLELLVALALRNRDRVALIWPLLHEYFVVCLSAENVADVNSLVERGITGLMRICQRLLPYKEDTAETLLHSLKLIVQLNGTISWKLADRIAFELLQLLKTSAPYVRSDTDWRTICAIYKNVNAVNPEAAAVAFEAFALAARNPAALSADSYMVLLETCIEQFDKVKQVSTEAAQQYVDLIDSMATWLVHSQQGSSSSAGGGVGDDHVLPVEAMLGLWFETVKAMVRLCKEPIAPLRDSCLMLLSRFLMSSEQLRLNPDSWVHTIETTLVPLCTELARFAGPKTRSHPGAEKSVRLAVSMLIKTVLQYIEVIQADKDFYEMWQAVLQALQDCMAVRHEAVQESVPENAKNMLLVLASSGILTPHWKDATGRSLWDLTFSKARNISSGLNPGLLESALSPRAHAASPRTSVDGAAAAPAPAPAAVPAEAAAAAAPAAAATVADPPSATAGLAPVASTAEEAAAQAAPDGHEPAAAAGGTAEEAAAPPQQQPGGAADAGTQGAAAAPGDPPAAPAATQPDGAGASTAGVLGGRAESEPGGGALTGPTDKPGAGADTYRSAAPRQLEAAGAAEEGWGGEGHGGEHAAHLRSIAERVGL